MFASSHSPLPSLLDAVGMGIGFTATLTLMGIIRELIGAGTVFGISITANFLPAFTVMLLPPGGFFVFGVLVALSNKLAKSMGKKPVEHLGCEQCPMKDGCTERTVSE